MVKAEESGNIKIFYKAIFKFTEIGLDSAENEVLSALIEKLLPTIKRFQYLTLKMRTGEFKNNIDLFKKIIKCLENKDIKTAEKAIIKYIKNETKFALDAVSLYKKS